jgi:hypothetical protein
MKSALIWHEDNVQLAIVDGDWRKYQGIFVNAADNDKLESELSDLVYDEAGDCVLKFITPEEFAKEVRAGAAVVVCGFWL